MKHRTPEVWLAFTATLYIPHTSAEAVWQALASSDYLEVKALCFHVGQTNTPPLHLSKFRHLVERVLRPTPLIHTLEMFVRQGRLDRRAASSFEEGLCQYMDRHGEWKLEFLLKTEAMLTSPRLLSMPGIVV